MKPPKSLRDGSYYGRKLGHGEGYIYPHDDPRGFDVDYLPDELKGKTYYTPSGNGEEASESSGSGGSRRPGQRLILGGAGLAGVRLVAFVVAVAHARCIPATSHTPPNGDTPRHEMLNTDGQRSRVAGCACTSTQWGDPAAPPLDLPARGHGPRRAVQAARGGALGRPVPRARARSARPWALGLRAALDVPDARCRPDRDARRPRDRRRGLGRPLLRRPAHPRARGAPPGADSPRRPARPRDPDPAAHRARRRRRGARRTRSTRRRTNSPTAAPTLRARSCSRTPACTSRRSPTDASAAATAQAAAVSIFAELASDPPPPETLRAPTLLIYAPAYGLVREEQLAAYADRVEALGVPGMHMVMWDAFDEVADAVPQFLLQDARAEG